MNEPAMFKALVRFLWIPALLMVLLAFMPRPAHAALKGYPDSGSEGLGNPIQSPWKKQFFPLFGESTSLDDIEQNRLRQRGAYDDPQIHFALSCAFIGCPMLRAQAARVAFLDYDWRLNDARP